jgi:hypothetical protein
VMQLHEGMRGIEIVCVFLCLVVVLRGSEVHWGLRWRALTGCTWGVLVHV